MSSCDKISMDSSSEMDEDLDADFGELEGFDDFTLASSWERLISEIEAVCRMWLADGSKNLLAKGAERVKAAKNLHRVMAEFTYGIKTYCLEYFFHANNSHGLEAVPGFKSESSITGGDIGEWRDGLHYLQLWFGVKDFLIIFPQSMSRVVLDAPEATKLLSAVAIALSNCGSIWPAFVPVHDPTRKAYKGIQNLETTLTRRFEADRIGSQVPVKLMHLEGLYELFISKLAFASSDFVAPIVKVHFTMRLTYRIPVPGHELEQPDENESQIPATTIMTVESDFLNKRQWDDDCPWAEWYSVEDPVKGFELISIWSNRLVESPVQMAEFENVSTYEADKWFLVPITLPDSFNALKDNQVGFASRLHSLVEAFHISFEAQFIEDFAAAENPSIQNLTAAAIVPPPTVLDRILKDLFHEGPLPSNLGISCHEHAQAIKGAPLDSLFAQFCLHSLWFGSCNIRAISVLWIEFVREVRWCWEELQPLPRMPNNGTIDLSSCLVHQKLQMLAICINKKSLEYHKHGDAGKAKECDQSNNEVEEIPLLERNGMGQPVSEDILVGERGRCTGGLKDVHNFEVPTSGIDNNCGARSFSPEHEYLHQERRGSAGPVGDLMLLKTFQRLHAPFTQDAPIMTQDMHEERQQAIEALSNSLSGKSLHAQLEREILASDMSAFKAANPESVFEDFIRWHSPGDWIENFQDDTLENQGGADEKIDDLKDRWPPKGELSKRMSESGNSWHQIWNNVPALPVSEQKPFLDPNREGEKVLHYLETLRPHQLLGQMICTAFRAAADTLNRADFGRLQQMRLKIEQLYLTIASSLKPLQGDQIFEDQDDLLEDLKRLCLVLEVVERLVIFATSLHQKLCHAPRLAAAIFNDHLKHSMPKMNMNAMDNFDEDYYIKQFVRMYERESVAAIFSPPTPSQSWRKVLSMGNFLNGHEPVMREVIFSCYENHNAYRPYGKYDLESKSTSLQTHMMYICGTSNDLQVALSVASSD